VVFCRKRFGEIPAASPKIGTKWTLDTQVNGQRAVDVTNGNLIFF